MPLFLRRGWEFLRLSLPLAAMEIPVVATVAIDTVLLGRIGTRAVGAGGLAASIFLFVSSVAVSMVTAVGHEAAYRAGRKDGRGIRGVLGGGLIVSAALGGFAAAALIAATRILRMLGQDAGLSGDAAFYLFGVAPGLPFLLLAVCFRGMIASAQQTGRLVVVAAAAVATKALLMAISGWWLIPLHGTTSTHRALFACGVTTSLTFVAMGACAWRAYQRSRRGAQTTATPQQAALGASRVIRRSLSIGVTTAVQTGFFTVVAILCGRCGADDLAAHQIANQCTLLPLMLAFGMSQAAATLSSREAGEGRGRRAERSADAVVFSAAVMLVVAALLGISGSVAVRAILPPGTPDQGHVVALAWKLVIVGACCLPADGMQNVAMGALRGSWFGRLTLFGAFFGYWLVGIPLAWWLGERNGLGAVGVWVGVGVGLHVSAAILLFLVFRIRRRSPEGRITGRLRT